MKHSSSLPLPPASPRGMNRPMVSPASPRLSHRSSSGGASLPPPPVMKVASAASNGTAGSQLAQNMAASMTIEEMRQLHRRALAQAEAKQTELRLVLASRYRELVGSSDEVTKMRERAHELHQLVHALPGVMEKVIGASKVAGAGDQDSQEEKTGEKDDIEPKDRVRRSLAELPRKVHLSLDEKDVYGATTSLVELFTVIAQHTDEYPMATALAKQPKSTGSELKLAEVDDELKTQLRMTFLYMQTLPSKIIRMSREILLAAASYMEETNESQEDVAVDTIHPSQGTKTTAAALSTLHFLDLASAEGDPATALLDVYFDSKSTLLKSLLSKLYTSDGNTGGSSPKKSKSGSSDGGGDSANNAEAILSKIVLILQYDIILNPYQIFILKKIPGDSSSSIPITVPPSLIKAKTSKFLSAHLPLIRTKVQSILVDIAGTTASALGKIRQSLYDKTDGVEYKQRLDILADHYNKGDNGVAASVIGSELWDDAVDAVVDLTVISNDNNGAPDGSPLENFDGSGGSAQHLSSRKFSLWSALFSNTFSSLVHSLLSTAFYSVHTQVAQTLRSSLANAPPLSSLLPHEAHRNTLFLASQLDTALLQVSDDAHELLVHAEERVESERRLRQSLYVQTCEIMGRLLCELRRMLGKANTGDQQLAGAFSNDADDGARKAGPNENADAVKQLIIGRLCFLLKFRLTALPRLLDPESSPAAIQGAGGGMISLLELSSAFELADDDDDGLITFDEATEAADSAFSGTPFHGAEMVRETLLLSDSGSSSGGGNRSGIDKSNKNAVSSNDGGSSLFGSPSTRTLDVTLHELALLSARGLKHEDSGARSALGTIQASLDNIIVNCFEQWAGVAVNPATRLLQSHVGDAHQASGTMSEAEYQQLFGGVVPPMIHGEPFVPSSPVISNISPHIVTFLLDVAATLNRSICPSDTLPPVPSMEYARSMGIVGDGATSLDSIPTMVSMIRRSLLAQSFKSMVKSIDKITSEENEENGVSLQSYGPSALLQLQNDLKFVHTCYFERNHFKLQSDGSVDKIRGSWDQLTNSVESLANKFGSSALESEMSVKRTRVMESCDLYLSSLFGQDPASQSIPSSSSIASALLSQDLSSATQGNDASSSLLHAPLPSTCRFSLLPVQSDRTLADIQLRSKYKDREAAAAAAAAEVQSTSTSRAERVGNVMSSGLGFFNSILKNKN